MAGDLRPETETALAWTEARYVELDPEDDDAYWRLLCAVWAEQESIWLVEQDMAPTQAQLQELAACDQLYCSQPYISRSGALAHGWGCIKLAARLMQEQPGLPDGLWVRPVMPGFLAETHWWSLGGKIHDLLAASGVGRHEHASPVRHLAIPGPHPRQPGLHGYAEHVHLGIRRPAK